MNVGSAQQTGGGTLPPDVRDRVQEGVDRRVDRRLDRRGERIDERQAHLDDVLDKAGEKGYELRVDDRLERRETRIDERQDPSSGKPPAADNAIDVVA